MVRMLQKHMSDSGALTKKKVKYDKKPKPERAWANGKEFYCDALEDLEEAAKSARSKEFLANSTVATKNRETVEDEVRNEMATK